MQSAFITTLAERGRSLLGAEAGLGGATPLPKRARDGSLIPSLHQVLANDLGYLGLVPSGTRVREDRPHRCRDRLPADDHDVPLSIYLRPIHARVTVPHEDEVPDVLPCLFR